jgi:hypothetical protein
MAHYDLTKPPKFIVKFFSTFRKWKLGKYKKKKVRQEKTLRNRMYFVKFTVKIEDPINPQESHRQYEMFVPAKAAFFAKKKAKKAIIKKLDLEFFDCDIVSDEELEAFKETKEQYLKDVAEGIIVKD